MSEIVTSLKGFGTTFEAVETARIADVFSVALEAATAGAEIIAQGAPVDMGILKGSINAIQLPRGAQITIDAPHAAAVELGSRPHVPPIGPLIRWAERHGATNPEAMARSIQNKIMDEGTKPRHFVRNKLPKLTQALGVSLLEHLRRSSSR